MVKASYNRKVTPFAVFEPKANKGKGRWKPVVGNTFGLKAGASCPDLTPFCKGCYAASEEKVYTSVGRLVAANLEALVVQRVYRIDWDGDLFSRAYAAAWAEVCRRYPDVQFWLYTRSFVTIQVLDLLEVSNLSVYLSVDEDNAACAQDAKRAYPWVRLAFCGRTWDDTEVLASKFDGERKGPRCPELTGRMAMVNAKTGVGACVECGLCVYGRNNVRFAIKNTEREK